MSRNDRKTLLPQARPSGCARVIAGQRFQGDDDLVDAARLHVLGLTEKVGWPISIAVHVGRNMNFRDSSHANTALTFEHYYPAFTLLVLDSASGKLSLAYADREQREAVLQWMYVSQDIDIDYLKGAELSLDPDSIRAGGYAVQGRNQFNRTLGKTSSIAAHLPRWSFRSSDDHDVLCRRDEARRRHRSLFSRSSADLGPKIGGVVR